VPLGNPIPTNAVSANLGPRYASDRGTSNAATGSKIDITVPTYVVATSATSNSAGQRTLKTEYSYAGMKADTRGRGLLGFRQVMRQQPGPNGDPLTVATQYLQDYPYTGVASRTETYASALNAVSPTNQLSRTVNIYCDQTAASGAETTASETAPCRSSAKIVRPYVRQSIEEGWDLAAKTLPKVTTTNTFNGGGDPLQIVVRTEGTAAGIAQAATKTTTNTYQPDNTAGDSWVFGRLARASVQSVVPNSLVQIQTSAGTAPNASASSGPLPAQPKFTTAQLIPVIETLLLGD